MSASATIPLGGGGREQPNPAFYTIVSARYAGAGENAAMVVTEEAGALAVSETDTPAFWTALMAWSAQPGNTIEAWSEPVAAVPGWVRNGQMILALHELDLLDAVDAAVAQADALSQRLWANSSQFDRDDARVIAIATAIGLSSEQLDDLFKLAATK